MQHAVRVAQVGLDQHGGAIGGQQLAGVGEHHRIVIYVDHPGTWHHRLHDLMRIALGGQTGSDVDELADTALLGHPAGCTLVERAVRPGCVLEVRQLRPESLHRIPVRLEVVLSIQHVVIHSRGTRRCRIHPGGSLLGPVHLASIERSIRGAPAARSAAKGSASSSVTDAVLSNISANANLCGPRVLTLAGSPPRRETGPRAKSRPDPRACPQDQVPGR